VAIPEKVRLLADEYAIGGPPDDEGGYAHPAVVAVYYAVNGQHLKEEDRFSTSWSDPNPFLNDAGVQWVEVARVYPVLRGSNEAPMVQAPKAGDGLP